MVFASLLASKLDRSWTIDGGPLSHDPKEQGPALGDIN